MQFRLRTLLIVLAMGPILVAWGNSARQRWIEKQLLIVEVGSCQRGTTNERFTVASASPTVSPLPLIVPFGLELRPADKPKRKAK